MNALIIDAFAQLARDKGMDKDMLQNIIEKTFLQLVKKKFGLNANASCIVNVDRGDIEINLARTIVEVVEDSSAEISIKEVNERGNEDELDIGEEYTEKIRLEDFERRLIMQAKQIVNQQIRDVEKDLVYNEYKAQLGEIVIGDIYQIRKSDILVNHNKNELLLPREEQIPRERYKKGETIRATVKEVRKGKRGPEIIISRADNTFLRRLFEIEVPEIYDNIIQIKAIAREPGERAKVAVFSADSRIDAVGACVGMKGVRIHAIVRELNNENIDVINWSNDPETLITRALSPGKIKKIEIDNEEGKALVYADNDQASVIVGKNGVNIRLASKLLGLDIDLIREQKALEDMEESDDIELIELRTEINAIKPGFHEILIQNKLDTALEVLKTAKEDLYLIDEVTPEEIDKLLELLADQYEEEEE